MIEWLWFFDDDVHINRFSSTTPNGTRSTSRGMQKRWRLPHNQTTIMHQKLIKKLCKEFICVKIVLSSSCFGNVAKKQIFPKQLQKVLCKAGNAICCEMWINFICNRKLWNLKIKLCVKFCLYDEDGDLKWSEMWENLIG